MKFSFFPLIFILLFLISSCTPIPSEKNTSKEYCTKNTDCVCGGIDTKTGNCYIGNLDYYVYYVNRTAVCPDFCGGIAGNLVITCLNNVCKQINKNINPDDEKFCEKDTDCVRQNSCCDCGMGNYVNKKYYKDPNCKYVCMCATRETTGKCINNECTAVPAETKECNTNIDCGTGGCSGQICTTRINAPNVITTCEYTPEYDCYKKTVCSCINSYCQWDLNQAFYDCMDRRYT